MCKIGPQIPTYENIHLNLEKFELRNAYFSLAMPDNLTQTPVPSGPDVNKQLAATRCTSVWPKPVIGGGVLVHLWDLYTTVLCVVQCQLYTYLQPGLLGNKRVLEFTYTGSMILHSLL